MNEQPTPELENTAKAEFPFSEAQVEKALLWQEKTIEHHRQNSEFEEEYQKWLANPDAYSLIDSPQRLTPFNSLIAGPFLFRSYALH